MAEVRLVNPVPAHHFVDLPPQGEAPAGSFTYYTRDGIPEGDKAGMIYTCPCGCGQKGSLAFRKYADQRDIEKRRTWEWDGNVEAPTLMPSIHHVGHWHGYLTGGVFRDA